MIIPKLHGTHTVLNYCSRNPKKKLLIVSGIHGDEPVSAKLTKLIQRHLDERHLLSDHDIYLLARYNPWGLSNNTIGNANGVDLNRNFPTINWTDADSSGRNFRGQHAGSEAETKSFIECVEAIAPQLIITLHEPFACIDFDGPLEPTQPMLTRLFTSLKFPINQLGARPGSMGTYFGVERGIPVITIELEKHHDEVWLNDKAFALAQIFMRTAF